MSDQIDTLTKSATANRRGHATALTTRFTVVSINIEGFSEAKARILSNRYKSCDVLCVQEIHRGLIKPKPHISGFKLAIYIPHPKYGSAIFVRHDLSVENKCHYDDENFTETLTIVIGDLVITSIYKPPRSKFQFTHTINYFDRDSRIVLGDFNSHGREWGYKKTDRNGKAVKKWAEQEKLSMLHDNELQPSFFSCRWKRGYNPDLIFVSENISHACHKTVGSPIPKTQHRPILCHFTVQSSDEGPLNKRSRTC